MKRPWTLSFRPQFLVALLGCILIFSPRTTNADEAGSAAAAGGGNAAAEMARKLQNPLANIKAIMTDNAIGFDTGIDKGTSYAFQFQPVYAIDMPELGFTFIPRAVFPIVGLEPGTDVPRVGQDGMPTPPGSSRVWGLGDSIAQFFFAPYTEKKWKWGVGPQVSFATRTDSRLRGPDWGAGVAAVITGDLTPSLSFAGLLGNHWSFDGKFNTATIQPMFFYNVESIPGAYIGYNAVISADWKASSGNTWTVPLGLSVGRTFDMGDGHGLDLSIGPYYSVVQPEGGPKWQLRFGITWVFP